MKDHDIIIAVAKLDGWTNPNCDADSTNTCYGIPPLDGPPPKGRNWSFKEHLSYELPHYLTSRDAIIPVIGKICTSNQEIKVRFLTHLRNLAAEYFDRKVSDFDCLILPTKYFSIALLKATGKWEE